MNFTAIILGAGMGTRMKSAKPKVLHEVCGKPLCGWVIEQARLAGATKIITVVGHCADQVKAAFEDECEFVTQEKQLGTGHAVMQALDYIKQTKEPVVVLNGDTPLITADTIRGALFAHMDKGSKATVLTSVLDDAAGYGRIIRDDRYNFLWICEDKDCTPSQRKIKEVNSGMYVFDPSALAYSLQRLEPNNAQGEYYLTDTLGILSDMDEIVGTYTISDSDEIRGVNDRVQLYEAECIMRSRIIKRHMRNGVTVRFPDSVMIENDVEIGADTVIEGNVSLKGATRIGKDCVIGAGSEIENSVIGDSVNIRSSVILESAVLSNTNVGPFAYIRPNCTVGENVKVGDFVELKNSSIGDGTKISHLTYVGDSDVGKNVNFGCGTVTVNYDGKKKYRTTIGDNAFIGCNTNLVSPVNVGSGAYTAAGSTITEDVPENNLSIARARQVNKDDWKDKRD